MSKLITLPHVCPVYSYRVCVCDVCMYESTHMPQMHMRVVGHLCGITFLFPPLHKFWGWNSGHLPACRPSSANKSRDNQRCKLPLIPIRYPQTQCPFQVSESGITAVKAYCSGWPLNRGVVRDEPWGLMAQVKNTGCFSRSPEFNS